MFDETYVSLKQKSNVSHEKQNMSADVFLGWHQHLNSRQNQIIQADVGRFRLSPMRH